jgi:hypothetical protein
MYCIEAAALKQTRSTVGKKFDFKGAVRRQYTYEKIPYLRSDREAEASTYRL